MSWPSFWQKKNWITISLLPISKLVCYLSNKRLQRFKVKPPLNPVKSVVIVVGNVVVGGTGKTPFIQWLAGKLEEEGISFGIISRGYGGKVKSKPLVVSEKSSPKQVGDEPVLLAKNLKCPIVVSPKRVEALTTIMRLNPALQVIMSDDGLQHFALPRQIEIAVFDGKRCFGNGYCMPSGPLRESVKRLNSLDAVVCNGSSYLCEDKLKIYNKKIFSMSLNPVCFRQVSQPENTLPLNAFSGQEVLAMAGIGNPQRFFKVLEKMSIKLDKIPLKDHQTITPNSLHKIMSNDFIKPLLMTQKDAVKCQPFAPNNLWYLEISPQCDDYLAKELITKIKSYL